MKLGYCYESSTGDDIFPFGSIFGESLRLEKPEDVADVDAILLWGGTDIHPSYYGQAPHPMTQNKTAPSPRDKFEWLMMVAAQDYDKPIIGICRGAQFLCAFAGYPLIQHVTGHHGSHKVMCQTGPDSHKLMTTSSDHHQMMCIPKGADAQILAWSFGLSMVYQQEPGMADASAVCEPEVVHFPNVRGLAVQGHPEWQHEEADFVVYVNKLIVNLVNKVELV